MCGRGSGASISPCGLLEYYTRLKAKTSVRWANRSRRFAHPLEMGRTALTSRAAERYPALEGRSCGMRRTSGNTTVPGIYRRCWEWWGPIARHRQPARLQQAVVQLAEHVWRRRLALSPRLPTPGARACAPPHSGRLSSVCPLPVSGCRKHESADLCAQR
jgi:hypothetical protein